MESGKNNARPELMKAIAHAKKHEALLVIAKLDRLSRNVYFISSPRGDRSWNPVYTSKLVIFPKLTTSLFTCLLPWPKKNEE